MRKFLGIEEVVNLLGITKQAVHKNRRAGKYVVQQVKSEGGKDGLKYEIALTSLPKEAQSRYQNDKIEAVMQSVSVPANTAKEVVIYQQVDPAELTERQRDKDRHRATICRFVDDSGLKVSEAISYLNTSWALGTLSSPMQYALDNAFDKRNPTKLAIRTYWDWVRKGKETGSFAPAKRQADLLVKPWYAMAIALYRRPQKPTFQYVVEKLAEHFEPTPSYAQVTRFFNEKYSQSELLKGRNTGMKLRSLSHYTKRTAAGMMPWDELHADGWATHFTAPHPITGEYVTLEVWSARDVATRYVPPMAVGLSESYEVIAKCQENAVRCGGRMAIWQNDSTKIVKGNIKFVGDPILSIADRAGITIVHPKTVGNAQANGIAENFHVYLDKQSRELSTYQHKNMDTLSFRKGQKLVGKLVAAKRANDREGADALRKLIAKNGSGLLFESFQDAVDWLEVIRTKWNNHAHSSLPWTRDAVTGKKRHQSPQEAFDDFKANGWEPMAMDEAQIVDLFRPRRFCVVRRGAVAPYHKDVRFRHEDLPHWEGKKVAVSFDIMDSSQVWVMDLQGSLIGVAQYCDLASYRSFNALEAAKETRALAQIKGHEKKIAAVKERVGLSVIEGMSSPVIELQRVDFSRVEIEPELQRVEYVVEEAVEPKLQTLADFLAEESKEEDPMSREETVAALWGEMIDEDDDFNSVEEAL